MKKSLQIPLTQEEKACIRKRKIRVAEVARLTQAEIALMLHVSPMRAKEIHSFATLQQLPSIGIRFVEDLHFMGIYCLEELRGKDPVALLDQYERMKGAWYDPCLEDQFRLIVYFANGGPETKQWWDFTNERKAFRLANGYPADRPKMGAHLL